MLNDIAFFCGTLLPINHEPGIVLVSGFVAMFAAYTTLNIVERAENSLNKRFWIVLAALVMGGGIWSMHFLGMIAFKPLRVVRYDVVWTLISFLIAVCGSGVAYASLIYLSRHWITTTVAGMFMGLAIASMHFVGMAGYQVAALITYNWWSVAESVIIAVGASIAALTLALYSFRESLKALAALILGLAVTLMHYVGIQALQIDGQLEVSSGLQEWQMAMLVCGFSLALVSFALFLTLWLRDPQLRDHKTSIAFWPDSHT